MFLLDVLMFNEDIYYYTVYQDISRSMFLADQHATHQHMNRLIHNTHRVELSYSKMQTKNIVLNMKGPLIKATSPHPLKVFCLNSGMLIFFVIGFALID